MIEGWDNSHLPPLKCGSCRACCLGDTVKLQPGEDPARYKTRLVDGRHELRKGKDGNCVYLGRRGCRIQDSKPLACRVYDCRVDYERVMRHPHKDARDARLQTAPLKRGREIHPYGDAS